MSGAPDLVTVNIPRAGVEGICERMFGMEATLRTIADVLEGDEREPAIRMMANELQRLYCDLDISAWPQPSESGNKGPGLRAV